LRELRSAIDGLAAQAVPDTRANRPLIAAAFPSLPVAPG
jgi:hypothetical protein